MLGKKSVFERIPAERPSRAELKEKLGALIDAADYFDSDLTQFIGHDNDGNRVIFIALFAIGNEAASLARLLTRWQKRAEKT